MAACAEPGTTAKATSASSTADDRALRARVNLNNGCILLLVGTPWGSCTGRPILPAEPLKHRAAATLPHAPSGTPCRSGRSFVQPEKGAQTCAKPVQDRCQGGYPGARGGGAAPAVGGPPDPSPCAPRTRKARRPSSSPPPPAGSS